MKKLLITCSLLTIGFFAIVSSLSSVNAYSSGPPAGMAGAPADGGGANCTNCHLGSSATTTTGIISSNIPPTGFVGGTTYNFSLTVSGSSNYGFEITPQTPTASTGIGTLIADAGTHIISSKYLTHTSPGTGTTKVWTFQWTAPMTGNTVTFYGSFLFGNANGSNNGDVVRLSSQTYTAASIPTGLDEKQVTSYLSVFPNPSTSSLTVFSKELFVSGTIFSMDGHLVKYLSETELISKSIDVSVLNNGLYYLQMKGNNQADFITKFMKD